MDIKLIELKANDSDYINVVANWYGSWWVEKTSIDEIRSYLSNSNNIIITKLLFCDGEISGVYQILKDDKIGIEEYTPYLANVYVKEEKRGLKLSKILIEDAVEFVKKLNYKQLYLHTKHTCLYQRYGFKFLKHIIVLGKEKNIFKLDLK